MMRNRSCKTISRIRYAAKFVAIIDTVSSRILSRLERNSPKITNLRILSLRFLRNAGFLIILTAALLCSLIYTASAFTTQPAVSLANLTVSSNRVFYGECVGYEIGSINIAGGQFSVTTYEFKVTEHFKGGGGADVLTFRQLGTPQGGALDLGSRVGLPIYQPGSQYVLFLLPDSQAGLTSPTGLYQGVFIIDGDQARGTISNEDSLAVSRTAETGAAATQSSLSPDSTVTISFKELRSEILRHVRGVRP